jgi:elongation factor G
MPPVKGAHPQTGEILERHPDIDEPFCALAFKVAVDSYVGKLTYFRIYSGNLKTGAYVINPGKARRERITKILRMHANHREEIEEARAGDIVAGVGLKDTVTGDTLCTEKHEILLESINFPEPVIDVAIEPKPKRIRIRLAKV